MTPTKWMRSLIVEVMGPVTKENAKEISNWCGILPTDLRDGYFIVKDSHNFQEWEPEAFHSIHQPAFEWWAP